MKKLSMMFVVAAMCYLAGCGGGAGDKAASSIPTGSSAAKGAIAVQLDDTIISLARVAGREAEAVTPVTFTITAVDLNTTNCPNCSGTVLTKNFTVSGVPVGTNRLITITKGTIKLKSYVPEVKTDETSTKAVDKTTNAVALIWENMGKPETRTVEQMEAVATTDAEIKAVVDALTAKNYSTTDSTVLSAIAVAAADQTAATEEAQISPTIAYVLPNSNSQPIATSSSIIYLGFSKPMKQTVPSAVSVLLTNVNTGATSTITNSSVSWGSSGTELSINFGTTLTSATDYVVAVTINPTEIKDLAGNALSLPSTLTGAAIDSTAKSITVRLTTTYVTCELREGYTWVANVSNSYGNITENISSIQYDTAGTACSYTAVTPSVARTFNTTLGTNNGKGSNSTLSMRDSAFVTKFTDGTTIASSGATYVGSTACSTCHSSIKTSFDTTNHATALKRKSDEGTFVRNGTFTARCIYCHSLKGPIVPTYATGATYGSPDTRNPTTPAAGSGAFGLDPENYSAYTAEQLAQLVADNGGIQCENCHGPASLHVAGDQGKIVDGVGAMSASTCAVCHDAPTHHLKPQEWAMTNHSSTTRNGQGCNPCHSGDGFVAFMARTGVKSARDMKTIPNTPDATGTTPGEHYKINCATCHDPHATNGSEYQTRFPNATLCIQCHSNTTMNGMRVRGPYKNGTPHDNHQGDSLLGVGLINPDGKMLWGTAGLTLCQPAAVISQNVTPSPNPNPNYGVFTSNPTTDCGSDYKSRDYVVTVKTSLTPAMGDTTCVDCHMYEGNHHMEPSEEACHECHSGMNVAVAAGKIQSEFAYRNAQLRKRFTKMKSDLGIATKPPAATAVTQPPAKGDNYDASSAAIKAYYNINWNFGVLNNDFSKGMHNPAQMRLGFDYIDQMLKANGY